MAKVKIEVEVEVTGGPKPEHFTFVSMSVGDEPSCQLPPDVPAPRRLLRDLALAAGKKLAKGG